MNQELTEVAPVLLEPEKGAAKQDWIKNVLSSPAFVPAAFVTIALFAMFWALVRKLPALWMYDDGYYTHGFLVPFISGYVLYRSWPYIKDREVKPMLWAPILLLPIGFFAWLGILSDVEFVMSATFVATIVVGVAFVAGWNWVKATLLPIGYLFFALPIWTGVIHNYTNPLQIISTKMAFYILKLVGLGPMMSDSTTIMLGNFTLDVGVPCSGLRLLLAITAFTVFFMLIARLKWISNLLMVAMVIPLCLFINGLRIALIGIVGNAYGSEAGHQFHDYSGYITLLLCFVILFKYARLLGWKD